MIQLNIKIKNEMEMEMGENISFFGIGSIFGLVGTVVLAQPLWLVIISAFLTGAFLYLGKLAVLEIVKHIKKFKK